MAISFAPSRNAGTVRDERDERDETMRRYELLNNVDHQNVRIVTDRAARFGDGVMKALTFPFEFRNVQAFYPILFQQDGDGELHPVALFGFQENENLFLGEDGWRASYIPAMMRREPFLIGFQEVTAGGGTERMRVLSLDMSHPRVTNDIGEALFEPLGGRTPFLEDIANLLEKIYEGLQHGKAFVAALERHELLEAVTMEITLRDGSTNQLLGFHCIAEEALPRLSAAALGELNEQDFLMPLFMALASMSNVQRLVELKNATVGALENDGLAF